MVLGKIIKKYPNLFITLAYISLTLVMTMPVIFKINTDIPGGGDAWEVLSRPYRLTENINIDNIPSAFNTILHYLHPLRLFNYETHLLFFHLILGEPLAYNLLWLSSFVLAALGAYLLVNYLTKSKIVAFISGIIYSFSPIHFAYSMGFGGATHIEWIPFYILFLLKCFYKPRAKNFILAFIFFSLVVSNEPHFAAYTFLLTVVIFLYYLIKKPKLIKNKKFLIYVSTIGILALALLVWKHFPLIKVSNSEINYLNPGIEQATKYSTDSLGIVTPPPTHLIYGKIFENIYSYFTGNDSEHTTYIGFTVLFFSILALIYKKGKDVWLWSLSAFLFYILSIGPFFHFMGLVEPKIPMPYFLIYEYVPFFKNIRGVGRMFIVAMISFAVLSGFGIKYFLKKYNFKKHRLLIPIIITFLILFEFLVIPIKTSSIDMPDIYRRISEEKGNFKILEIPGSTNYSFAMRSIYYEKIHGKKAINGITTARRRPNEWDFQMHTPIINSLLYNLPQHGSPEKDIIDHTDENIGTDVLNFYNIKYIILSKNYIGEGENMINLKSFLATINYIEDSGIATKTFEDDEFIVYAVKGEQDLSACFLKIKDNWKELKANKNTSWRWMQNNSILELINTSKTKKKIKLDLSLEAENSPRKINIYFNNELKNTFIVSQKEQIFELFIDNIKPGKNTIEFKAYDENDNFIEVVDNKTESPTIKFNKISYENISEIQIPEIYKNIATSQEDFNIMQLNKLTNYSFDSNNLNNFHFQGKEILTLQNFEQNTPFIKDLYFNTKPNFKAAHDIFDKNYYNEKVFNDIMQYHSTKYVLIDKENSKEKILETVKYLQDNKFLKDVSDNYFYAFEYNVQSTNVNKIIPIINNNWSKLMSAGDGKTFIRRPNNQANIKLINFAGIEQKNNLKFRAWTCNKDDVRILKLYLNNDLIGEYKINREHQWVVANLEKINNGENIIKFETLNENNELLNLENDASSCTFNLTNLKLNDS